MKLKKVICIVVSLVFTITSLCVSPSFLSAKAESVKNVNMNMAQGNVAHGVYDFNHNSPKKNSATSKALTSSSNLISAVQLTLTRNSSTQLNIYGDTTSDSVMAKIGFTYITIQQQINGSWTDFANWSNMYDYNSLTDSEEKAIAVPHGYYYRAIACHYAEKNTTLWYKDTQSYNNETTVLYM
ncbi:MAG TPA: hypothetical protein VHO94_02850 [Oscillospiraceae bacterium]|nr:hypothetical protein [Oscillospiraceae bacterium]